MALFDKTFYERATKKARQLTAKEIADDLSGFMNPNNSTMICNGAAHYLYVIPRHFLVAGNFERVFLEVFRDLVANGVVYTRNLYPKLRPGQFCMMAKKPHQCQHWCQKDGCEPDEIVPASNYDVREGVVVGSGPVHAIYICVAE